MAGPAIRYWEFARVLSRYFTVILAVPPLVQAESQPEVTPAFEVCLCQTQAELQALTRWAEVIITVGANLSIYPFLTQTGKPLVVDTYIPFMLEHLHQYNRTPLKEQQWRHQGSRGAHTLQIRSADFMICASEKQRDFWLGWLSALGRVNPYTHADSPSLSKLIAVVPFGLPREKPVQQRQVLKGVYQTIGPNDKVILWGGGIWDWLDTATLLKSMATLAPHHPELKLFFMGIKNPNPTANMEAVTQAVQLSQTLNLYNHQVFFNDWVPYQERQNYLLEADIGVNLHLNHIETRFSFRTRLLDYIWAGLPILTSTGDVMSEEVTRWQLGRVVEGGNVEQVSQSLVELTSIPDLRQHYQPHFERIRARYEWETVMAPLLEFCQTPYLAADKPHLRQIALAEPGLTPWWSLPGKVLQAAKNYGVRESIGKIKEYLQWKLKR